MTSFRAFGTVDFFSWFNNNKAGQPSVTKDVISMVHVLNIIHVTNYGQNKHGICEMTCNNVAHVIIMSHVINIYATSMAHLTSITHEEDSCFSIYQNICIKMSFIIKQQHYVNLFLFLACELPVIDNISIL